jgi:hypothetical protein
MNSHQVLVKFHTDILGLNWGVFCPCLQMLEVSLVNILILGLGKIFCFLDTISPLIKQVINL